MNVLKGPLLFRPVYKDYLWGGERIPALYGRTGAPRVCAESWEISAHPDGTSMVAAGPWTGERLDALVRRFGRDLLGRRTPQADRFPLLFKLIDARDRLSVQVHPNDANATAAGGEPKTEMWYVLGREPGATLYAGLADGIDEAALRRALTDGTAERCLVRLAVETGQALFIPGGLVHAIGAGCLVYEVQQNSNTTYRLFDWNRVGADGKPRALHIEESFKTIDWSLRPPRMTAPRQTVRSGPNAWSDVVTCAYFTLRRMELASAETTPLDGSSFHALFVEKGSVGVSADCETLALSEGTSVLIPACATSYTLIPEKTATVLVTTL